MMKWRAIIGVVGILAIFACLHLFFFGNKISEWNQMMSQADADSVAYQAIIDQAKDAKLRLRDPNAVTKWLGAKKEQLAKARSNFEEIKTNFPRVTMPIVPEENYVQNLFDRTVSELKMLVDKENTYATESMRRVNVLAGMDIRSTMVAGVPLGNAGFHSYRMKYPQYYMPSIMQRGSMGNFPRMGCIDFWFKPDDWDTRYDIKKRTLFFAKGREITKNQDSKSGLINLFGGDSTFFPMIYIYKDKTNKLCMVIKDIDGHSQSAKPAFLDEEVNLKPDQWTHLAFCWDRRKPMTMYMNGRDITGRQPSRRSASTMGDDLGMDPYGNPLGDPSNMGPGMFGPRRSRAQFQGTRAKPEAPKGPYKGPEGIIFFSLGLGGIYENDPYQNQADGTFDEFRLRYLPKPIFNPRNPSAKAPGTILHDSFENEFLPKEELDPILNEMVNIVQAIRLSNNLTLSRLDLEEQESLRTLCGLSTDRLRELKLQDVSLDYIRRVHVINSIHEITGRGVKELFDLFCWLNPEEITRPYESPFPAKVDMESYVAYLRLCNEIIDIAMSEKVGLKQITHMKFAGEDLTPDYAGLEIEFNKQLDLLIKEFSANVRGYYFNPPGENWEEELDATISMDERIMEMTNKLYGGGSYDPDGNPIMMDPDEMMRLETEMNEKMAEIKQSKRDNMAKLEQYLDYKRRQEIPSSVRWDMRAKKLEEGGVTYKKRSIELQFKCDATSLASFIYELEFGANGRLASINAYQIDSDDNAQLSVTMTVDFHQVEDVGNSPSPSGGVPQPRVAVGATASLAR
jgi:hypothetical protein